MGRKLIIKKKDQKGVWVSKKPSKAMKKQLGGLWFGDYWFAPWEIAILGATASVGMLVNSGLSFFSGPGVIVRHPEQRNTWAIAPRIPRFDITANYMPPSKSQYSSALFAGAFLGVAGGAWLLHDKKPLRKTISG